MKRKTKKAVALKYEKNRDFAPRLVAAGKDKVAQRIIEKADKSGVPVYKDPQLAESLMALPLGIEIPPELYYAVAEVLSFVYRLDCKKKNLLK
jgi:flagellar biosynthesis protein